ncbi:hypothetical protein [Mesorhizobium sp.]|uniref:hypothetical protein n=1 Tax=Mesorhizobium sp. TaxID=1871066 RepID=UPI000FE979E7|nr:hypothetical protein [Mesorhizobium sp.]RWB67575.1 MAG: hypothetical protein EOQ49_24970 [Mesorhizobium sp.]
MKHSRSSAEVEIRDAVVARFRQLWPDARIIHEMNVEGGAARADIAAVQPERLWICEIKSERDTLSRLPQQLRFFGPSCHALIVAAHAKWTLSPGMSGPHGKHGGRSRLPSKLDEATKGLGYLYDLWEYPEPVSMRWRQPYTQQVPWYRRMLELLWADEVRAVAAEHRISCMPRTPAYKLAPDIARMLTGREIEHAVCTHLRARTFAEADPPIEIARKIVPAHPASVRQESML